jgi:hypothetical protein
MIIVNGFSRAEVLDSGGFFAISRWRGMQRHGVDKRRLGKLGGHSALAEVWI